MTRLYKMTISAEPAANLTEHRYLERVTSESGAFVAIRLRRHFRRRRRRLCCKTACPGA